MHMFLLYSTWRLGVMARWFSVTWERIEKRCIKSMTLEEILCIILHGGTVNLW